MYLGVGFSFTDESPLSTSDKLGGCWDFSLFEGADSTEESSDLTRSLIPVGFVGTISIIGGGGGGGGGSPTIGGGGGGGGPATSPATDGCSVCFWRISLTRAFISSSSVCIAASFASVAAFVSESSKDVRYGVSSRVLFRIQCSIRLCFGVEQPPVLKVKENVCVLRLRMI
jgi:hypothetical protein